MKRKLLLRGYHVLAEIQSLGLKQARLSLIVLSRVYTVNKWYGTALVAEKLSVAQLLNLNS